MMTVVFVVARGASDSGSTLLRSVQLRELSVRRLQDLGIRTLLADHLDVVNSVLILSKNVLLTVSPETLEKAKRRGNILVSDPLDGRISDEVIGAADVLIAAAKTQQRELMQCHPHKPVAYVGHHVDLRIPDVRPMQDRLRIGYFGELYNAKFQTALFDLVDFHRTNTAHASEASWINHLPGYNAHYSVRAWQSFDRIKPFTKGFVAAHTNAVIVPGIDDEEAKEWLTEDYPFWTPNASVADARAMIERLQQEFGGPSWRLATEMMRDLKERSSRESIAEQITQVVAEIANADHSVHILPLSACRRGMFVTPQLEYRYARLGDKRTTARFLARFLASADLFIDVGAHEGFFSLLAAQHNPALEIIAIEPDPACCEVLRKNIAVAGHETIMVRQMAVSSETSVAKSGIASQSDSDALPIDHADVATVSIDCLLRGRRARRVVVRIDAEQHAPAVLAEAGKLLGGGIDLCLLIEIDRERQPPASTAPENLLADLDRLGFAVTLIDDEQDRFHRVRPNSDPDAPIAGRYANLYCVPKDRALNVVFFVHGVAATGAERSLMELVDELVADYGTVCTVVSPSQTGPLVDSVIRSGAAVVVAPLPWWGFEGLPHDEQGRSTIRAGLVRGLSETCRSLLPVLEKVDPDVVFTQALFLPWGAFSAYVLEKPHAWHVCEFGELDHDLWFSDPFADILAAIATGSSFIFTAIDAIRTNLFPSFDPERIRTIYRHIPIPENVRPAADAYLVAGATKLGLFGSVQEGKGQHEAVQAVAELVRRGRDVELLLAGHRWASSSDYHARIDRLVDQLGLRHRVRMPGFLDDPFPAMAATDICLVCSRNEAFGRAAAEAMLLGRPVVYARSGGVAEYMDEGVTGLAYRPGNIAELVERIEALIDDPARAAAIGAAAQRHAREKFTRDGYGGEVFRTLLGLRGTTSEIGTPRRVVKAMAEAISADATQLAALEAALNEAQNAILSRDRDLADMHQNLTAREHSLAEVQEHLAARDRSLAEVHEHLAARGRTLAEVEARLNALESSTSWRVTHSLRIILAPHPGMRRVIRRAVKLVWWTVTLQLLRRLHDRWGQGE